MIKIKKENLFLIICLLIFVLYIVLYSFIPSFSRCLDNFFINIKNYSVSHGYLGLFILSVMANATILISIPYSVVPLILAGLGLQPILLALVAGAGAVLGESVNYFIGYGGGRIFGKKYEWKFQKINDYIYKKPKLIPILVYLIGAFPIPDDILLIPLGVIRYNFWKTLIPMTLGKITQNLYFALLGKFSFNIFNINIFKSSGFIFSIITYLIIVISIYFILRINWEKVLR